MWGPEFWGALAAAIALDAYLGTPVRPGSLWHPRSLILRAAGWAESRLNRPQRRARDLRLRGALVVAVLAALGLAAGAALAALARAEPLLWVLLALIACALIGLRAEHQAARALGAALADADAAGAHAALARLSRRDPRTLDLHGMVRAAIEGLLARFAAGWLAPVLAWAAGGPAGLFAYSAVMAAGERLGGRDPRLADFGAAPRAAARALSVASDRLAGLALVAGALAYRSADAAAAWRTLRQGASSWALAACAGALGLALGGPRRYARRTVAAPWIGGGRARAEAGDLERALALVHAAALELFALVALAAVLAAA